MSLINEQVEKFRDQMAELINSAFGINLTCNNQIENLKTFKSDKDFYVALMITGSFYGEYILGMNKDVALKVIEESGENQDFETNLDEIKNVFGEFVNIITGSICPSLKTEDEIEINLTAPRFYLGKLFYPDIEIAKTSMTLDDGNTIDCFFYVDKMKLDITQSYKEALGNLFSSYENLKDAHQKIVDQQSELIQAEKIASLGVLSAGIAHNLNTPLGTISLSSDRVENLLESGNIDKLAILKSTQIINKTTHKMAEMIKVLRGFSNNLRFNSFRVRSVKEILDESLADFTVVFDPGSEGVTTALGENIDNSLTIECSEDEIKKSILCLLQNSFESLNEQDDLKDGEKWVRVEVQDKDDQVELKFINSGLKMKPSIVEKVFDPFYTQKDPTHAGLGLSLVKGIFEGHGGSVVFDEQAEQTTFVLSIPKKQLTKKEASKAS